MGCTTGVDNSVLGFIIMVSSLTTYKCFKIDGIQLLNWGKNILANRLPKESFKLGTTRNGKDDQNPSEELLDKIGKQSVWDEVNSEIF